MTYGRVFRKEYTTGRVRPVGPACLAVAVAVAFSTRRPYNSLYVYGLATNEKTRRSRLGRVSFRNVSNSGESEERMLGCSLRFTAAGKRREEFLSSRIYIKPSGGVPAARRDCVSSQTVNLWCSSDRARATHVAVWYG